MNDTNRFFKKILKQQFDGIEDACWLWTGAKDEKGFARFSVNGKNQRAHIYSYDTFIGTPKYYLQHTCGHNDCVNPRHVEDKKNVGRTIKIAPDIVRELHSKGKSVADIAEELDCSKSIVYKIIGQGGQP